ncbi:MAG: hypothetical protein KatS3mg111_0074 [Pirellulaceae bacterium]|nr:MAG: hypothetical protein KatS3mg111_0074 [Pirellulaceae bacterium]
MGSRQVSGQQQLSGHRAVKPPMVGRPVPCRSAAITWVGHPLELIAIDEAIRVLPPPGITRHGPPVGSGACQTWVRREVIVQRASQSASPALIIPGGDIHATPIPVSMW